ncbi:ATP-binding protein [Desulfotalea psychrophila]|uniref:Histidine kinase/HSP90-like ATPase domain-containing protein n=1 Tax=Desulfotalea psychrophila (strain LSv54 / DSM 12343) TaxID=177439 RepID=Q6AM04_DESPS|nr:ATP-binding protein [Desulfotalea psychrophila]CAG36621.1 hypothetical protein DP1892 [Desulfotalea psychrophila LSv54]
MEFIWARQNTQENLQDLREDIESLGKRWQLDKKTMFNLQLIVDEFVTNLVSHCNCGIGIHLTITKEEENLLITIKDNCSPFNPLAVALPNLCAPLCDREAGGLGIFLIRKKSRYINYRRTDSENITTITLAIEK